MKRWRFWSPLAVACACAGLLLFLGDIAAGRPASGSPESAKPNPPAKQAERQDDSFNLKPAKDLGLRPEGQRKADALAHYLEGMAFEESGETTKALKAY